MTVESELVVPWITSWSGESSYSVRPCRYAGNRLALWQPYAPGSGVPLFKSRHAVRGRKSIAEGLCTVCGLPLPEECRWLFPRFKRNHQRDGTIVYTVNEPPVHQACAELALKLCPHIRREGWTAAHFTERLGRFDVFERGANLNAALGINAPSDATVLVGTYLTVSKKTFDLFYLSK